jgi:hypothetical protein
MLAIDGVALCRDYPASIALRQCGASTFRGRRCRRQVLNAGRVRRCRRRASLRLIGDNGLIGVERDLTTPNL